MGAYLSSPVLDKEVHTGENERARWAASAMQGWRIEMEDAHTADLDVDDTGTMLFSVFDGHGGKEAAKFAARHISAILRSTEGYAAGDIPKGLYQAYLRVDELMCLESNREELESLKADDAKDEAAQLVMDTLPPDLKYYVERAVKDTAASSASPEAGDSGDAGASTGDKDGNKATPTDGKRKRSQSSDLAQASDGMEVGAGSGPSDTGAVYGGPAAGCTAVTSVVHKGVLYVANAGDSRCVLCRGGKAFPLTEDHKPNNKQEEARIYKAGGFVSQDGRVNGSLNLSRALGDMEYKRNTALEPQDQMVTAVPDVESTSLTSEDDFMVLACDGIWEVLDNDAVIDFCKKEMDAGKSEAQTAVALCDRCCAKDTCGPGHGCDNMSVVIVRFKGAGL